MNYSYDASVCFQLGNARARYTPPPGRGTLLCPLITKVGRQNYKNTVLEGPSFSKLSNKQLYSRLAKGNTVDGRKRVTYASQTESVTNPNIKNLILEENTLNCPEPPPEPPPPPLPPPSCFPPGESDGPAVVFDYASNPKGISIYETPENGEGYLNSIYTYGQHKLIFYLVLTTPYSSYYGEPEPGGGIYPMPGKTSSYILQVEANQLPQLDSLPHKIDLSCTYLGPELCVVDVSGVGSSSGAFQTHFNFYGSLPSVPLPQTAQWRLSHAGINTTEVSIIEYYSNKSPKRVVLRLAPNIGTNEIWELQGEPNLGLSFNKSSALPPPDLRITPIPGQNIFTANSFYITNFVDYDPSSVTLDIIYTRTDISWTATFTPIKFSSYISILIFFPSDSVPGGSVYDYTGANPAAKDSAVISIHSWWPDNSPRLVKIIPKPADYAYTDVSNLIGLHNSAFLEMIFYESSPLPAEGDITPLPGQPAIGNAFNIIDIVGVSQETSVVFEVLYNEIPGAAVVDWSYNLVDGLVRFHSYPSIVQLVPQPNPDPPLQFNVVANADPALPQYFGWGGNFFGVSLDDASAIDHRSVTGDIFYFRIPTSCQSDPYLISAQYDFVSDTRFNAYGGVSGGLIYITETFHEILDNLPVPRTAACLCPEIPHQAAIPTIFGTTISGEGTECVVY